MKHIGSLVVLGICVVAFSIYTYREGFTPYVISPPITSMTDARITQAKTNIDYATKNANVMYDMLLTAQRSKNTADNNYASILSALERAKQTLNDAYAKLKKDKKNNALKIALKNAENSAKFYQTQKDTSAKGVDKATRDVTNATLKFEAAKNAVTEATAEYKYLMSKITQSTSSGQAPPAGPGGGSGGQSFGAGSGGGTNTESIPEAAPNFPNYKFKGCWTTGHDTSFPVLTDMYLTDIKSMDECVKRASQMGLSNVGYDGKGKCIAGKQDYTTSTSTQCYNTYKLDKSWLVYSNK
jgi:hypothetical protein